MKKIIMIVAMAAFAFSFSEANAQKVIKDAEGNVFLDVQDMPAGTFSTATLNKVTTVADAGNSVYKRLQIAKNNLLENKTNFAAALGLAISYNTAITAGQVQGSVSPKTGCSTYSVEGSEGKWRVPTMRELQLISIMESVLVASGVTALNRDNYVSSTELSSSECYMLINGTKGATGTNGKGYGKFIRCVREVN